LVRGGTNTVLTRRVTEVANSRIVEISFRAGGEALIKIKLYKIIHTSWTLWWGRPWTSFARAITRVTDELIQVSVWKNQGILQDKSYSEEKNDLVSLQEEHWLEVAPIQFSQEGSQRLQTPELLKYP
jgi:hypothetical protein